jgi:hypothetical protein
MIDWETGKWEVPFNAEEAANRVGDSPVAETMSWLNATRRLVTSHGKQFMVGIIPVGIVDPDYVEFWRPWPSYYSYSLSSDACHRRLAAALRQSGFDVGDLRDALDGVRGTYRLADGNWTDCDTQIVAACIADALLGPGERPASNGSITGY